MEQFSIPRPEPFYDSRRNHRMSRLDYAELYFGDSVRPLTLEDVRAKNDGIPPGRLVRYKLGDDIDSVDTLELKQMQAQSQQEVDLWLMKHGKLAWEDVGAEGWFDSGTMVKHWQLDEYMQSIHHILPVDMRIDHTTSFRFYEVLHTCYQARRFLYREVLRLGSKEDNEPQSAANQSISSAQDNERQRHQGPSRAAPRSMISRGNWYLPNGEPMVNGRGFFELPAELRNKIYEMAVQDPIQEDRTVYLFPIPLTSSCTTTAYQQAREPGLLLLCKQIREEAKQIYFTEAAAAAMHHLLPILPYVHNMDLISRFRDTTTVSHGRGAAPEPHNGTATVVVRLRDNTFKTKVYIEDGAVPHENLRRNYCKRTELPQIDRGCRKVEKMLQEVMGKREIEKEGNTMKYWMGYTETGKDDVDAQWAVALGG